jgi:hypothetical protein
MRPEVLNPLFAEVEALPGVGPQVAKALKRLDITRAIDLAYHLPTGTIERVRANSASQSLLGRIVVLDLTPLESRQGRSGPLRIFASDGDGDSITLVYFNNPGWAKKQLPIGELRTVSGRLDAYGDEWQIVHPEVMAPGKAAELPLREPIYPLTEGIANRLMRELALAAVQRAPDPAQRQEAERRGAHHGSDQRSQRGHEQLPAQVPLRLRAHARQELGVVHDRACLLYVDPDETRVQTQGTVVRVHDELTERRDGDRRLPVPGRQDLHRRGERPDLVMDGAAEHEADPATEQAEHDSRRDPAEAVRSWTTGQVRGDRGGGREDPRGEHDAAQTLSDGTQQF